MKDITNSELALAGLIAEEPRHGYQVEQLIEQRGMRNWTEIGFSSIYFVLNKLEGAGLLASSLEASGGGPARKVYRVTSQGMQALRAAVLERLARPRSRSGDFDLALANLPLVDPAEAAAATQQHRAALIERLAGVEATWRAQQAQGQLPPHAVLLFERSVALIRAELDWVTAALERGAFGPTA